MYMNFKKHQKIYGEKTKRTAKINRQNPIIVENFNTPLSVIHRPSRQKITKQIEDLNYTINQFDLIDINRTCHLTAEEHTLLSSGYRTFTTIDHKLGYKPSFNKFRIIVILQSMFQTTIELSQKKITIGYMKNSRIFGNYTTQF